MTLASIDKGAQEYLLAFADDEHMMGSHLAWWIGIAPFLEEDLSLCSIAQDELGHAIALYELLVDDVDHFALRRQPSEYRSCSFVEAALPQW
ncbi:MAG: Phenylacetic acid catabolic protein, partial [Actinomycetota bacterium]|nr:Phenylacetic acid catabolic protein [Actinomycetota bacterium]